MYIHETFTPTSYSGSIDVIIQQMHLSWLHSESRRKIS